MSATDHSLLPGQRVTIALALAVKYVASLSWVRKATGYAERWPENRVYQLTIDQANAEMRDLEAVAAAIGVGDFLLDQVARLVAEHDLAIGERVAS